MVVTVVVSNIVFYCDSLSILMHACMHAHALLSQPLISVSIKAACLYIVLGAITAILQ